MASTILWRIRSMTPKKKFKNATIRQFPISTHQLIIAENIGTPLDVPVDGQWFSGKVKMSQPGQCKTALKQCYFITNHSFYEGLYCFLSLLKYFLEMCVFIWVLWFWYLKIRKRSPWSCFTQRYQRNMACEGWLQYPCYL